MVLSRDVAGIVDRDGMGYGLLVNTDSLRFYVSVVDGAQPVPLRIVYITTF
jgi:hypothetical protein